MGIPPLTLRLSYYLLPLNKMVKLLYKQMFDDLAKWLHYTSRQQEDPECESSWNDYQH